MTMYLYKGRNPRGDAVVGKIEADDADAVANQLFSLGITPINIDVVEEHDETLGVWMRKLGAGRPTVEELILFSRQMYTLEKAGVPLVRGMKGLAESTRNPVLRDTIHDIVETVESGRDLASAFARHPRIFSPLYVNMVRVGENSGQLEESFLRMYQYLSLDKKVRDRIKQAVRYPIIVLIAISIAIAIITLFVIPTFAQLFARSDVALPLATRAIIAVSDFMVAYWWAVFGALGAAFVFFRYWKRTEAGRYRWDKMRFQFPVVGDIVLRATLARFARAFSTMYRSGVPLVQALTLTAKALDNEYLGERVLAMRNGVERGESLLRSAAGVGLFTPLVLQMIAVGEESGQVDTMLDEVAEFYEREVDYDVENLSATIEPILIVGIAFVVLVLALGVFLPMWDLAQAVS
ncbi:MAG: type II secretion system F family protein [Gammaproteobacteria bacterium]